MEKWNKNILLNYLYLHDFIEEFDANAPVDLPTNPYENPCRECILCRFKVKLNYKNARLLQQFVSTFSGRLYDRHITGTSLFIININRFYLLS